MNILSGAAMPIAPIGCKMVQIDLSGNDATVVCDGPALLVGIYVDVVLSAHTVTIGDSTTVKKTLPASQAVGSIPCWYAEFDTNITVTPNASSTGTITVFYIPVTYSHTLIS